MNLEIPFYGQLNNEIPEEKQRQVCGICCVKMILDYLDKKDNDANDLIKEGELIKAFDEDLKIWKHEGLVRVLRNHGVLAYPQEFRSVFVNLETNEFEENENEPALIQKGVEKIINEIERGRPVVASVAKGFSDNTDSHLILIKGYEKNGDIKMYVHDPLVGDDREITLEYFLQYWRRFTIFVD